MEDPEASTGTARLACPFLKMNPYGPPKAASCYFPGFPSVSRMKEHIYREHRVPYRCGRCFQRFDSKASVNDHLREDLRCIERQEDPVPQVITDDQEALLRSKKRARGQDSEGDKWRRVFRILFPEVHERDIPDPYCHYPQPLSDSEVLSSFRQFSRPELSRLVSYELELAMQNSTGGLTMAQILRIVSESHEELFTLFGRNGHPCFVEEAENVPPDQTSDAMMPDSMVANSEGSVRIDILSAETTVPTIPVFQAAHDSIPFNETSQPTHHHQWTNLQADFDFTPHALKDDGPFQSTNCPYGYGQDWDC